MKKKKKINVGSHGGVGFFFFARGKVIRMLYGRLLLYRRFRIAHTLRSIAVFFKYFFLHLPRSQVQLLLLRRRHAFHFFGYVRDSEHRRTPTCIPRSSYIGFRFRSGPQPRYHLAWTAKSRHRHPPNISRHAISIDRYGGRNEKLKRSHEVR